MNDETDNEALRQAITLAVDSVATGGGPFGAVVVRDDRIVGCGSNRVTADLDPTAHAEIVAIREACRRLAVFALGDCRLYASCEPCPMCLAAIYWARIPTVIYSCSRADAANAGFDDALIYRELAVEPPKRLVRMHQALRTEALAAFAAWRAAPARTEY